MKALPPLAEGQCAALVETEEGAKSYSMQRIRSVVSKRCSRRGKYQVGHLHLCTVHARLAYDGLIDEEGGIAPKQSIADVRKYPKKFPGGLYVWARNLPRPSDL